MASQQGASSQQQGAFSLFPNAIISNPPPPVIRLKTPRPRRSQSNDRSVATPPQDRRAATPQSDVYYSNGRQTPQQQRSHTPLEFDTPRRDASTPSQWPLDGRQLAQDRPEGVTPQVQQPRPANDVPIRTETAFSEANTLVRSNSGRSRRSIAKHPLNDEFPPSNPYHHHQPQQPQHQPALRSIFPTYNPEVPLGQQAYAPTQASPARIPRAVISRQSYYEDPDSQRSAAGSPQPPAPSSRWHRKPVAPEPPVIPKTCSTEQLKGLWKVTNGWKASASEGRVYCLKMSQQKDAPVYTLSSASQPFYNFRLDPTSASANVTVSRYDPSKPYKAPKVDASAASSGSIRNGVSGDRSPNIGSRSSDSKNWQEVLGTKLEEPSRKHPPNDGLVALLMPTPATKMALEKADDPVALMTAEKECARLVWDEDSGSHFLVHGALEKPFFVSIERCPAWSRTEYTLEHNESAQHLAKLTRDGTGGGWLELDTSIASKIDSFYILDVAVTALLLVAAADENHAIAAAETFEPPPPALQRDESRRLSSRLSGRREDKKQQKRRKMEEFEIDIESQDGSLDKASRKSKKSSSSEDKLPFFMRVVVKLVKGLFKVVIWVFSIIFKCVSVVFKALYSCVGSKY